MQELRARVAGLDARYRVLTSGTIYAQGQFLVVDGRPFELSEHGIAAIFAAFPKPPPVRYVLSRRPTTAALLMNEHFSEAPDLQKATIILDDGRVVGFHPGVAVRLSGAEVLDAVCQAVPLGAPIVAHPEFTEGSFSVRLLGHQTFDAGAGDILESGIELHHSLDGASPTQLFGTIVVLRCLNGLTTMHRVGPAKRPRPGLADERGLLQDRLRAHTVDLARSIWDGLTEALERAKALKDRPVGNVPAFVTRAVSQGRLPVSTIVPRVLQAWQSDGGGTSAFSVLQALTAVGTHDSQLPVGQRRQLQRIAGVMVAHGEKLEVCESCLQPVRRRRSTVSL